MKDFFEKHKKGVCLLSIAAIMFIVTFCCYSVTNIGDIITYQPIVDKIQEKEAENAADSFDEFINNGEQPQAETTVGEGLSESQYQERIQSLQSEITKADAKQKEIRDLASKAIKNLYSEVKSAVNTGESEIFTDRAIAEFQKDWETTKDRALYDAEKSPNVFKYSNMDTDTPRAEIRTGEFTRTGAGGTGQVSFMTFKEENGKWKIDAYDRYYIE